MARRELAGRGSWEKSGGSRGCWGLSWSLGPLLLASAETWGPPEASAEMLPLALRPPHFAFLIGVSGLVAEQRPQRATFWAWPEPGKGPGEFGYRVFINR